MKQAEIIILMVMLFGVFCMARHRRCPPGIWCLKNDDEGKAKLAKRENLNESNKRGFRRINGAKKDDADKNMDIVREFEGYFYNY